MSDFNGTDNDLVSCPHCGEKILKKARLCKHCKKSVEMIECPFCAETILKSCKTCPLCGSLLVKSFGDVFRPLNNLFLKYKNLLLVILFLILVGFVAFILFEIDSKSTKWSSVSYVPLKWEEAEAYCKSMGERWRLPEMEELMSLLKNCPATVSGGVCQLNDIDWLSDLNHPCRGCQRGGVFSSLGDHVQLFSKKVGYNMASSTAFVYCVDFNVGGLNICSMDDENYFRCIRPGKQALKK